VSEHARVLVELASRDWKDLSEKERDTLDAWVRGASGVDLFLLLRYARGRWRLRKTSSSKTLQAIIDTTEEA
jgi:hypothetical protein